MCSTPQKHPAATVATAASASEAVADSVGLRERRVEEVNGRVKRDRKDGIVKAIMRMSRRRECG